MLTNIITSQINIQELPKEMLENLEKLEVVDNVNTHLPPMPNLTILRCLGDLYNEEKALLREIPDCPKLVKCYVSYNHIRKIPHMEFCRKLVCTDAMVYEIEGLPRVKKLYCETNRIKKLPDMKWITLLNCSNNRILELPKMNEIRYLFCNENYLAEIPSFPKFKILHCADNLNLTLQPSLTVEYIQFTQDDVSQDVKQLFPNARVIQPF